MNTYNGNSLYGKKWACCGDSFTAGVTGTLITEGRFKGQNIAYPYLIQHGIVQLLPRRQDYSIPC